MKTFVYYCLSSLFIFASVFIAGCSLLGTGDMNRDTPYVSIAMLVIIIISVIIMNTGITLDDFKDWF